MKWKKQTIASVCHKVTSGGTPSRKILKFYENGTIPWIKTGELEGWYLDDAEEWITEEAIKQSSAKLFPPQTVLMATYEQGNTITSVAILRQTASTNQACCAMIVNEDICHPYFLLYSLKHHKKELLNLALGASQRNLSVTRIANFEIPLPPLETQRRIAQVLSAYDDLIENNTRRIKALEQAAHDLYREWFVEFRFPGHADVEMVDSALGQIPQGWEVVSLEVLCDRITDGSHWSPKAYDGDDSYPMASVKDMTDWGFDFSKVKKISPEDYDKLVHNDCKPLQNDVLIAKDGSYLKHVFVTSEEIEMAILSSIAILRPNDRINPHILALMLQEPMIKARMANYVSGVAVPRIILKDFRKFQVVYIPSQIQHKFWKILEPVITQIRVLMKRNVILRETRDLLLPRLVSGQLAVDDIELPT